jgi:hypothetical protein
MLAMHPQVYSLPETHFFCQAAPTGRRYTWLGLARRDRARKALAEAATFSGVGRYPVPGIVRGMFARAYYRAFWQMLDQAALTAGKRIWVEKTPHHIDYVPAIARHVPGVRFIHILRDGRDVVASQYHAQQQDPEFWRKWSIQKMAEVWNKDVSTSLRFKSDRRHLLVSYERLLTSPAETLTHVTSFLGVHYDPAMLRFQEAAATVVGWRREHPWMQNVFNPLQDTRLKKYTQVFTPDQRALIEKTLLWGGKVDSQVLPVGDVARSAVLAGERRSTA